MLATELMTVKELWEIAAPGEAASAAGTSGLGRHVAWVTSLRASYPALAEMGQDYMVIARMALMRQLDRRINVSYLLKQLARAQAAALVIDEPLSEADIDLANEVGLPVLVVPDADLAALERALLSALVNREGQYARRESEIRRHLHGLYARAGIDSVLQELATRLDGHAQLSDAEGIGIAETSLPVPALLHMQASAVQESVPISAGGRALGLLTVSMPTPRDNPLDHLYIQEAATVSSIELLQHRARQETQEQLGAALIEALLDPHQDREAVVGRFRRLGYTIAPERRHQVIAVEIGREHGSLAGCTALMRDLQWAAKREGAELAWMEHQDYLVAFCSYGEQISERRIRGWLRQAADAMGRPCCVMGVSRTVEGVESLRGAVYQAMEACDLGRRVDECKSPHYYEDLGLYRLLGGLRDQEEMGCFYNETIGPLAEYDREKGAELVRTLEAFFAENANASSTARSLYVHRNTLNYRLQRIMDITGMDLDDPEARLSLQIGLKIHRLSQGAQRQG